MHFSRVSIRVRVVWWSAAIIPSTPRAIRQQATRNTHARKGTRAGGRRWSTPPTGPLSRESAGLVYVVEPWDGIQEKARRRQAEMFWGIPSPLIVMGRDRMMGPVSRLHFHPIFIPSVTGYHPNTTPRIDGPGKAWWYVMLFSAHKPHDILTPRQKCSKQSHSRSRPSVWSPANQKTHKKASEKGKVALDYMGCVRVHTCTKAPRKSNQRYI